MKTQVKTFREWVDHLKGQYHLAYMTEDLLGGWNIVKAGGRVGERSARWESVHYSSQEEAVNMFQAAHKKRLSRGFRLVYKGVAIYAKTR